MTKPLVIDEDGTTAWGVGQYSVLDKTGGQGAGATATNILTHRATGHHVDIDADYNVTDGWTLRNNHDDFAAQLYRTVAQNYLCRKFFGDGQGPNVVKVLRGNDPHWSQVVRDTVDAVEQGRKAAVTSEVDKAVFETPQKHNRMATHASARAALTRKADDVDARVRRVAI